MNPKAVIAARSRCRIASRALGELHTVENEQAFADGWFTFLTAWKSVFTSLEQGAKTSAESTEWFKAKRAEKNGDNLLKYLYEARNDEEHGLAQSVASTEDQLYAFEIPEDAPVEGNFLIHLNRDNTFSHVSGSLVPFMKNFKHEPAGFKLQLVMGRDKKVLWPPSPHLGKNVEIDPLTVAGLGLEYIMTLVQEAEALPPALPA